MDDYEFHPLSKLFPMMSEREYKELVADMKANGQHEPIFRFPNSGATGNATILDGRNRYRACRELALEPLYQDFEGNEDLALRYVISRNAVRRHLTAAQRAILARKIETYKQKRGRPSKDAKDKDAHAHVSREQAVKLTGASSRGVASVAAIEREGVPEIVEELAEGGLSIRQAEVFTKEHDKPEQARLIKEHRTVVAATKAAKVWANGKGEAPTPAPTPASAPAPAPPSQTPAEKRAAHIPPSKRPKTLIEEVADRAESKPKWNYEELDALVENWHLISHKLGTLLADIHTQYPDDKKFRDMLKQRNLPTDIEAVLKKIKASE